jgi:hypothetical protein
MIEKTPLYFEDFKKYFDDKLETHEPKYFKEFRKEVGKRFDKIDTDLFEVKEQLELHFEQIGDIKVEVTKTNLLLAKKAGHDHVKDLEHRTKKLENAVFA